MVSILMAVYNGEKYLSQQIESILAQTFSQWKLIICDDCSSDNSFDIIRKYSEMYPDKIFARRNDAPTGSAQANFMSMLKFSDGEYTMFADQDDVWLPDKISLTLNEMRKIEQCEGNIPVLVHTDMTVVDAELNQISHSFMKYCRFNPNKRALNNLIVQNNISGCTMMINRQLLELVEETPPGDIMMHDWWLGLAASAFGKIDYIDKPTSLYRQHTANQLGAIRKTPRYYTNRIKDVFRRSTGTSTVTTLIQAENFLKHYNEKLSEENRRIVSAYAAFPNVNIFQRWRSLIKYKLWKQNWEGKIAQLFMICN